MLYRLRFAEAALSDIDAVSDYFDDRAGEAVAASFARALDRDLRLIRERPLAFAFFHETGPPYRAKLVRLGQSTYWLVYLVQEDRGVIDVLRFWSSLREPGTHGL